MERENCCSTAGMQGVCLSYCVCISLILCLSVCCVCIYSYLGDGRFHLESIMIANPEIPAYR